MRVLAITNMYPPHHYGGYELLCEGAMQHLAERGDEVTVLTTTVQRDGVPDPPGGAIGVRRELRMWWDDHVLLSPPLPARARTEAHNQRTLGAALDAVRPDVVSIWNMGGMSMGLLATIERRGTPVVFHLCDDWLVYGPRLDAWSRLFGGSRLRRAAGRVIGALARVPSAPPDHAWPGGYVFMSEATRAAALERTGWSLPISGIMGGAIDTHDFPLAGGSIAPRPWRWQLLFVGRIESRKGPEPLVRALALMPPEATLRLIGPPEPAYLPELEAVIESCGLADRVTLGELPRAELRGAYASADVFVFPSLWAEPFGLVPIEAMACDTPVVASGTGGSAEFLVDGWNCLIAPPGDPTAIARCVERLAEDAALRAHLVAGGRQTAAWATKVGMNTTVAAWHDHAAGGFSGERPPDRRPPRP
jgi:glycosyltransferase involved in cell wall biosynthesis